jgi:hypothetical protein
MYTVSDNGMDWGEGYTYLSKSLGATENDGDNLWIGGSVIGKKLWLASALFAYSRKGDKNVRSRWQDSDSANIDGLPYDYNRTAFPSGTIETTMSFSLEGVAYIKDYADLRVSVDNRFMQNRGNIPRSGREYKPRFSIALGLHFSDWYVPLPR